MKHTKLLVSFLGMMSVILLTACSVNKNQPIETPTAAPQITASAVPEATDKAITEATDKAIAEAADMAQKTRDFILVGQTDRPEAGQYHWTEEFLNLLDMESLYADYITSGGEADDVEKFTAYITQNAPVPENWKEMFEAAFAEAYGLKIVKYELIQDTFYQVYVELDG
ncbi:MAG TPA: hypothetical protein VN608_00735, partial [Clostridia bacterium]|nr:hypothetical protein [Clostridia bacterium]